MKLYISDLREDDMYDASPLVEHMIALFGSDTLFKDTDWVQSLRNATESMYFTVERVKLFEDGVYCVYGSPYTMYAYGNIPVEVNEWGNE